MGYTLAADIGGTKLATAIFDQDGLMLLSMEIKSETVDGERLFASLIASFQALCDEQNLDFKHIGAVSIGLPGILDHDNGVVLFQNNLPWRDFPLKERLSEMFVYALVIIDSDVYMAAWGEFSSRNYSKETLVYITLSTGISCGMISAGRFLRGAGMAGEIGFSLSEKPGESLESIISGPALQEKGRRELNNPTITLKEMMTLYYEGNKAIQLIMDEAAEMLSKNLYNILLFADPHCVVLGGSIFNHHPKLAELVKMGVKKQLQNRFLHGKENRIEASHNQKDTGLIGAAARAHSLMGNK